MNSEQQNNKGFTLLELLITTSLVVLLMLTISTLFMTFFVGNSKTNVRKTIKDEGAYALSQMEFLLKNARHIDGSCTTGMTSITLISLDNGSTTLSRNASEKIASNSAVLTSDAVSVPPLGLEFNCTGEAGNRQVEILFTLEKDSPDGTQTETFNTFVNVRN